MGVGALYLGYQTYTRRRSGVTGHHVFDIWTQVDSDDLSAVIAWCQEQFGENGTRWMTSAGFLYLADPDDAFEFRIRWC